MTLKLKSVVQLNSFHNIKKFKIQDVKSLATSLQCQCKYFILCYEMEIKEIMFQMLYVIKLQLALNDVSRQKAAVGFHLH